MKKKKVKLYSGSIPNLNDYQFLTDLGDWSMFIKKGDYKSPIIKLALKIGQKRKANYWVRYGSVKKNIYTYDTDKLKEYEPELLKSVLEFFEGYNQLDYPKNKKELLEIIENRKETIVNLQTTIENYQLEIKEIENILLTQNAHPLN